MHALLTVATQPPAAFTTRLPATMATRARTMAAILLQDVCSMRLIVMTLTRARMMYVPGASVQMMTKTVTTTTPAPWMDVSMEIAITPRFPVMTATPAPPMPATLQTETAFSRLLIATTLMPAPRMVVRAERVQIPPLLVMTRIRARMTRV